jgi:hypothetical protein
MSAAGSNSLIIGAVLSASAAFAHLACIAAGARAYRLMGAGEQMARAVEAGKLRPTLITLAISVVLFLWSGYALGAAGVIDALPFTKVVLLAICAAYLGRAVAFPFLRSTFPENSLRFWLLSSGICLVIGLVHAYGLFTQWHTL